MSTAGTQSPLFLVGPTAALLAAAFCILTAIERFQNARRQIVAASELESRGSIFVYGEPDLWDQLWISLRLRGFAGPCVYFEASPRLSDADVAKIRAMTSLESVYLSGPGITDAGIKELGQLPQLATLWLDQTSITDTGLSYLHGNRHLRKLILSEANVSEVAVKKLEAVIPGIEIVRR